MPTKWKTISSKKIFSSPWASLFEDQVERFDGQKIPYVHIDTGGGVFVIAEDKNGSIYLVKQYRYPTKEYILSLPAGYIDPKYSLAENALKELREETGIVAGNVEMIGEFFPVPGLLSSKIVVFLATQLDLSNFGKDLDPDEEISETKNFTQKEIQNLIKSDKIKCGITLAALNIYLIKKQK